MRRAADVSRRSPLLTALLGLCLIVLAGLPTAATRHVEARAGDAVVAAVTDLAVAARSTPQHHLSRTHRALDRQLPSGSALPIAALVAFLLAVQGRRDAVGVIPRPHLLRASGRGPPVTS
ncbi:MAG: hypothetical protein QOI82_402 [Actinomycetota bacterium]|nr:hypothetical protein [Actinomycetota bacterium]